MKWETHCRQIMDTVSARPVGRQGMAPPELAAANCLQETAKVSTAPRLGKSIKTENRSVAAKGSGGWEEG